MDYQEAIERHIEECKHRIDVITDFMEEDKDSDKDKCTENIRILKTAVSAMRKLQMYKDSKLCLIPESVYAKQSKELDTYKQLGTLEEVREAVEKQRAKRPKTKMLCEDIEWWCPNCGESHIVMYAKKGFDYCPYCGQRIDWSEEE